MGLLLLEVFTSRTKYSIVKNVLRTVWNLLSIAICTKVDTVRSTLSDGVFYCLGCGSFTVTCLYFRQPSVVLSQLDLIKCLLPTPCSKSSVLNRLVAHVLCVSIHVRHLKLLSKFM
ncbi:unnamed protein product, partial [Sphacelaria rigidula]